MPQPQAEGSFRLAWWAGCLGLAGAGAHYALVKGVHHDVAYYVNAVGRWLDGARLYRDLIDVNVPTIYAVMALPIWAARRLHVDPMPAYTLFVLLLAAMSAGLAWHCARRILPGPGALPDILAGVLLVGFVVIPGFDFGQREHLAAILIAPYAVSRAGRGTARPGLLLRAIAGIAAGIGVALKPHLGLIAIGMEAALLLRRGSAWRPGVEGVLLALTAAAAAGATLLLLPEYHQRILPLARAVYGGFERPVLEILAGAGPRLALYLLMAILAVPLAAGSNRRAGDLTALLSGGALGGYAAYLLQSKGWAYHVLPALILSAAAFAMGLAARLQGNPFSGRPSRLTSILAGSFAGLAAAVLALDIVQAHRGDADRRAFRAPLIQTLREYAQGGPALFISLDVDETFPAVNYAGATYPYRWHHLLPLPGLYRDFIPQPGGPRFRRPEEMSAAERAFFESFVEDALAHPPRIVLVDRRRPVRPGLAPDLDLLAYFCQDPRFATLMGGYAWLGHRAHYDVLVPDRLAAGPQGCAGAAPQAAKTGINQKLRHSLRISRNSILNLSEIPSHSISLDFPW